MKKIIGKEVKIGVTFIVALGILIYGLNYLKGVDIFNPSKYVYVKYNNINGLIKSSPVYADGFRVGTVSDITYDYDSPGNIIVQVELDDEVRIPKGSYAELRTEMLGGVTMHILLSNNMRESYNVGDTIPGVLNNGIMDVLATDFVPQIERMMPKLDSILASVKELLADERINSMLANADNTMANLSHASANLRVMMDKDIPDAMRKLNDIEDNVVVITDKLAGLDYEQTISSVNQTLAEVKSFTSKLNSKDNTIGLLLNDSTMYNNLNSTFENASNLLYDLKAHPKRYVHFSLFGRKE